MLFHSSITQESMVATQKVSQELEETWNILYVCYIKGDAFTLVLQSLLENEQRAKCGGVVDGCYIQNKCRQLLHKDMKNEHQQ